MKIDITPVAKPRMTRSDKWKERPIVMKYRAFADELRYKYFRVYTDFPERVSLVFNIPTKNKKLWGLCHQKRPDIDNLVKSVLDALCKDDNYVFEIHAIKMWSEKGSVEIEEFRQEGKKVVIVQERVSQ